MGRIVLPDTVLLIFGFSFVVWFGIHTLPGLTCLISFRATR